MNIVDMAGILGVQHQSYEGSRDNQRYPIQPRTSQSLHPGLSRSFGTNPREARMGTIGGHMNHVQQLPSGVNAKIAGNAALNTIAAARSGNQHLGFSHAQPCNDDEFGPGEDFTFQ